MDGETEAHLERAIDEISEERDQLQAEIAELKTDNLQLRAVLNMAGQHLCRQKPTPARTIIIGAIRAKLRGEEVDEQNC